MQRYWMLLGLLSTALGAAELNVPVRDLVVLDQGPVNHVFGYGLVVGLEGSGDSRQALFAQQSLKNMLRRLGVEMGEQSFQTRNVAGVMVTGSLRPFGRAGDAVDVTVSALGDARSLQGGILLQTPLQDASGAIRGVAQGPLSIGGFNLSAGGSSVQKNHSTVGRVPGRNVERQRQPQGAYGKNESPVALHVFKQTAKDVGCIYRGKPPLSGQPRKCQPTSAEQTASRVRQRQLRPSVNNVNNSAASQSAASRSHKPPASRSGIETSSVLK